MKKQPLTFWILLFSALIFGLFLGWMNSLPHWDDTGITVGAILVVSFILGILMPKLAWLWAIIIGVCIFSFDFILRGSFNSVVAFVFAFIGAYIGVFFKKMVFTDLKDRGK